MTGAEKKLLLDIARNTEPQKVFDLLKKGKSIDSVYTEIMPDQLQWFDKMQLPEPWHGHLSRAKIMFIGDNPAVTNTKKEEYPTEDWSDGDIINYFDNYWENYSRNITPLVRAIKRLSNFLIDNCNSLSYCNYINDIYELKDIAVSTDIVHCKSEKNHGVRECKSPFSFVFFLRFSAVVCIPARFLDVWVFQQFSGTADNCVCKARLSFFQILFQNISVVKDFARANLFGKADCHSLINLRYACHDFPL